MTTSSFIRTLGLIAFLGNWGCTPATQKQDASDERMEENVPADPIRVDQGRLEYVATLPDGRVVSTYIIHRDPGQMEEPGPPQPMFIRYSNDNGLSWTEADTAFFSSAGTGIVSGGYPLVDREGNLHCFFARYYRLAKREVMGSSQIFHTISLDGGKTWAEPNIADYGHSYTGAFNSAIVLSTGRILFAVEYTTDYLEDRGEHDNRVASVYSDNLGKTWHVGTEGINVPLGDFGGHPGAQEPVLVELKDGRVWMIIRTQQGRFYQAFSSDGGETWTDTSPSDFKSPNAPGGILRLSDDRLVFCWNDLSQYPESRVEGSGRQYLYIAISDDNGKSWSKSRQIANREEGELPNTNVAYPFLTETKDQHLLVAYHRVGNREGVTWWYPVVEVLRIDPNWIGMPE